MKRAVYRDTGTGDLSDSAGTFIGQMPDPSGEPDGAWLRVSSGAAVWVATPAVTEDDLNLSDVTTANATTSQHGLLPKLGGGTDDFLRADGTWAEPSGGGFAVALETPSGTIDGSNADFTLSAAPDPSADLLLFKNGLLQDQGLDYTLSTDTVTFTLPPETGSVLLAGLPSSGGGGANAGASELVYRYTVTGSDKASIDTGSDTPDAGTNDWTNGDLLEVYMVIRSADASTNALVNVTLNNDTGPNYDREIMSLYTNATVSNGATAGDTKWPLNTHGSGGGASYATAHKIIIPDYSGTTFFKSAQGEEGTIDQTTGNTALEVIALGWRSTAAVTRLKVAGASANLKVGSKLLVYKRMAS